MQGVTSLFFYFKKLNRKAVRLPAYFAAPVAWTGGRMVGEDDVKHSDGKLEWMEVLSGRLGEGEMRSGWLDLHGQGREDGVLGKFIYTARGGGCGGKWTDISENKLKCYCYILLQEKGRRNKSRNKWDISDAVIGGTIEGR